ncbi:MAG: hypothetical protein ACRD6W_01580 [Nitrososphaerales archaeon]
MRHPWRVIALWLVAAVGAVAAVGLAPKVTTTSNEVSFLPSHHQSVQAARLQKKAFPEAAAPVGAGSAHAPQPATRRPSSES